MKVATDSTDVGKDFATALRMMRATVQTDRAPHPRRELLWRPGTVGFPRRRSIATHTHRRKCMCIYTHEHTCVGVRMPIFIFTHVCICLSVCLSVCLPVCLYVCMYMYMYMFIYMYMYMCMYAYIYVYVYVDVDVDVYVFVYVYVHVHVFVYMYIYIYMCIRVCMGELRVQCYSAVFCAGAAVRPSPSVCGTHDLTNPEGLAQIDEERDKSVCIIPRGLQACRECLYTLRPKVCEQELPVCRMMAQNLSKRP